MKSALAASVAGIDDEAATLVKLERQWRTNYMPHLVRHVEACLTSHDAAVTICEQGLSYLYENFKFTKKDGKVVTIQEAMSSPAATCPFQAATINGTKSLPDAFSFGTVQVPWSFSTQVGKRISGLDLELELIKAAAQGLMEPFVIEAIRHLNYDHSWNKKIADTCFVALGGCAAMGPTLDLLSLGATVVAVDIAVPAMWQRLIEAAHKLPGTLVFPVVAGTSINASNEELASAAGCNLIAEAPEILQWLQTIFPERHHVVGLYAYADSTEFVKVALAMDAIAKGMMDTHPRGKVSMAYMCSPTDVFPITVEAREESKRRATMQGMGSVRRRLWQVPLRTVGMGRVLAPNNEGRLEPRTKGHPVVDCIVTGQGPNYIFAKRLQHWRAVSAHTQGVVVSANIAPASHTHSVRKNKLFAAAYDGARWLGIEIFHPQTSSALMTTLMLHDIYYPTHRPTSDTPFGLFMHSAVHGGVWRQPYLFRTCTEVAAVFGLAMQNNVPQIAGGAGAVIAAAAIRSRF